MHYPKSVVIALALVPGGTAAQSITLASARAQALRSSPEVTVAREAVVVARGLERQAGAFLNPVVSYAREQTENDTQSASQDVIAAEQSVEWFGVRSSRRDAARARRAAAEARLGAVERQVAFDATRAYANLIATERRARLADTVARAFSAAATVSEQRLREGDISGFAARRIRLEAARYSALRSEAVLQRNSAHAALALILGDSVRVMDAMTVMATPAVATEVPATDSLLALALAARGDLAAARHDRDATIADARRAARERVTPIVLTAGSKSETVNGSERMSGLVAGVTLPLPLWDRRTGAIAAANADARRKDAELVAQRRRVTREVLEAADALRAIREQLAVLGPAAQADAAAALRAAQTAYVEGEITLLEWLDTVRAYQETEATLASLRAEVIVRAAALEHAVGVALFPELR